MANTKKKGLGRGADLLFSGSQGEFRDIAKEIAQMDAPAPEGKEVVSLKLIDIEPNKGQPRKNFDREKLTALRDSIQEHGVIQPILVTPTDSGTYKIIAGERRWRAAKLAGLKEMPCIIRTFEEQQAAELALVENLQREDLNPLEEAAGYLQLMETFHLTQDDVAQRVGKSRSAVANALRLNNLDPAIKKMVVQGDLTQGHARALLSVQDRKLQLELAQRIAAEGLNVRQTEALAARLGKEKKPAAPKAANSLTARYYQDAEDRLASRLGTRVKIHEGARKGKIEIEYYSKQDLERILFELRS